MSKPKADPGVVYEFDYTWNAEFPHLADCTLLVNGYNVGHTERWPPDQVAGAAKALAIFKTLSMGRA